MLTEGFWVEEVKPPGPVQPYVTPDVLELPDKVTAVVLQPRVPLAEAEAPGTEEL